MARQIRSGAAPGGRQGAVSYDMTTDERYEKKFANVSALGELSQFERSRFTVYNHGGTVEEKKSEGRRSKHGSRSSHTPHSGASEEEYESEDGHDHMGCGCARLLLLASAAAPPLLRAGCAGVDC